MAQVGLKKAAELTGKDRSTIVRAHKRGDLSATTGANGRTVYDIAELDRVFGVTHAENDARNDAHATKFNTAQRDEQHVLTQENEALRRDNARLEEMLAEVRQERDRTRADLDDWKRQAQALLTDQRPKEPEPAEPKPGFWRRLFR